MNIEIRDSKGTFHAKMGSIKDRDCLDVKEADDLKNTQNSARIHRRTVQKRSSWPR